MNPMMHHCATETSDVSRASGSFHDLRKLNGVSKLLTSLIFKSDQEDYESAKLKASIGIALFKYIMRYAQGNSHYFNRDRLVVSGHYAGRWQDLFVHLIAAKGLTVNPMAVVNVLSRTTPACNSSQAVSSSIGLAIAMRNLAMLYNKPGLELLDNMIWCVIDDAKFQQDSAVEAVTLAGCWKLNNICVVYDGTNDSASPNLDVAKLKTRGWNVVKLVNDDDLTATALCMALDGARRSSAPTLISIQSLDSSRPHLPPHNNTPFCLPPELYSFFQDVCKRSGAYEADWLARVKTYGELYPALAKEFWDHVAGKKPGKLAEHQQNSTAVVGPITPPLSPWPAEPRAQRGKHRSPRRDKTPQRPSRRPKQGGAKVDTIHIRPCDAEEAAGAFLVSIRSTELPTTISLPQNGAASFPGHSSRLGVTLGAYTFSKSHEEDFDLTLITAGVGIHYAMGTRDFLLREYCLKARIVSCPCLKLFQLQTEGYKKSVLRPQSGKPTVAIDFGNNQEWEPYADALVSLESENAEKGGNQPEKIGPTVKDFVEGFKRRNIS